MNIEDIKNIIERDVHELVGLIYRDNTTLNRVSSYDGDILETEYFYLDSPEFVTNSSWYLDEFYCGEVESEEFVCLGYESSKWVLALI
jgi:hypothetical protein